jgi:hypothetical protein
MAGVRKGLNIILNMQLSKIMYFEIEEIRREEILSNMK